MRTPPPHLAHEYAGHLVEREESQDRFDEALKLVEFDELLPSFRPRYTSLASISTAASTAGSLLLLTHA